MGIVTKIGDKGTTKLLSGNTVSKSDPRLNVVGTLDEVVAALGLARSHSPDKEFSSKIRTLQLDLMRLSAEFSCCDKDTDLVKATSPDHISKLESDIASLAAGMKLPRSFLLPGTTPCSSALELARAVSRRLEREAILLREAKAYDNESAYIYLNRLSDYLFLLARRAEIIAGVPFEGAS